MFQILFGDKFTLVTPGTSAYCIFFFVLLLNSLFVSAPHKHFVGKMNFFVFLSLLDMSTDTTWGITSPAL